MPREVLVATDGVRIPLSRGRVEAAALRVLLWERVSDARLNVTFVGDRRIAQMNWRHLRHRGPTDVIAFGLTPLSTDAALAGDIYVAPGVARRNAIAHGERIRDELLRLVVHGVLHVAGHDHPAGETRYASPMWQRQERILRSILGAP